MNDFTRLFDVFKYQKAKFPNPRALNYKYDGKWRNFSTDECIDIINNVGKSLLALGLKPGDKIGLISNNRPEWNFVDQGMLQVGMVNVPIYPTITKEDYKFIFNDAELKAVFVSSADLFEKVALIKDEVPSLEHIISFEKVTGCMHWDDFLDKGKNDDVSEVENIASQIKPKDLATIIYTSGTTGVPKGVMLSHDNILSNIKSIVSLLPLDHTHKALSFLPLCHIFERVVSYTYFLTGTELHYAESLDTIGDDLKEVKPHFFSTVPRLLEKVYEKIMAKGMEQTGWKKKIFFWAADLAFTYQEGQKMSFKWKIADKLIFSKWREAIGGNVIGIVTGAAAMQERLARFFSAAGIAIREGYGQTETSPVITVNRFEPGGFKFGTVGMTIPGVEVKLADNGEILCKGPNVMMGYYNRPDATAETIDKDGWLHTGDVGTFVDGKFLKITDRVKSLFKTSGGKYVAPQVIEEKMKESSFVEQIMVVGENKKFVGALIVPSFINLEDWCKKNEVKVSRNTEMLKSPEVMALFKKEVEKLNVNFSKIEKIKRFELLPEEWSIDTGELTPTMKVKRKIVKEKYKTAIDEIYNV